MRGGLWGLWLGAGALSFGLEGGVILVGVGGGGGVLTLAISLILVLPTVGLLWVLLCRAEPGVGSARYPIGTILLVTIVVLLLM